MTPERLAALRDRLAERAAQPPAPLARPPRYDDEWAAGVAWLDRCASDDVWPDPAPTEPQ